MKYPKAGDLQRGLATQLQGNPRPRGPSQNPWEVTSDVGLENVFADEDEARIYADELRRAGARDVAVVRRQRAPRPAALELASNPQLTKAEAEKRFYELIQDPDPAGMEIAQDLALEYQLSLADLGEKQASDLKKQPWESSLGYFRLSPSFSVGMGPPRGAIWTIDGTNRTRTYRYWWGEDTDVFFPGGGTRTLGEARSQAAADVWMIAKTLKAMPPDASWTDVKKAVEAAYTHPERDVTPPEIYERRSSKKQRTYAEAQDAALSALQRAGWGNIDRKLKIPHADSPNRVVRLWFKPQAVYITVNSDGHHLFKNARSISYGVGPNQLPDMRSMSGSEFVAKINELFPKALSAGSWMSNPSEDASSSPMLWRVWVTGYEGSYVDVTANSADDAIRQGAATQRASHHGEIIQINTRPVGRFSGADYSHHVRIGRDGKVQVVR